MGAPLRWSWGRVRSCPSGCTGVPLQTRPASQPATGSQPASQPAGWQSINLDELNHVVLPREDARRLLWIIRPSCPCPCPCL